MKRESLPQRMKRFVLKNWRTAKYSGTNYLCNLCGTGLATFLRLPDEYVEELKRRQFPHPLSKAETLNILQYSCPVCDSNDRDRLYALYLKKALGRLDPSGKYRFIDFAPSAALSHFLASYRRLDYRTADLFMENVDDRVDITNMALYADDSADMFLCSHVLEHVPDDRRAMRELYRILKPGGTGIVMSPIFLTLDEVYENPAITSEDDRWKHFGQNDHVRVYSKQGFIGRLEEAGFTVKQYDKNYFGEAALVRNGISPHSVLYVVAK